MMSKLNNAIASSGLAAKGGTPEALTCVSFELSFGLGFILDGDPVGLGSARHVNSMTSWPGASAGRSSEHLRMSLLSVRVNNSRRKFSTSGNSMASSERKMNPWYLCWPASIVCNI